MRTHYKFQYPLLLALILITQLKLSAQVDRTKAPEPGPAPEIRIGEYGSFELKNGLKVFVVENHKIPRVAYSLILDMDPFAEGDSMGYSSIAGQLLGTATTTRNKDMIDEEIDFIGASLSTSSGSIYGASLKKHNDKLLEIMADVLLNPVFKQEELDKIKKQTISALAANKTDPSAISSVVGDVLLFGKDHPYGEVTTEASVESVTLNMCEDYFKTYFRPNIAYLAIVGDVTLKEAKKLAKKYFGAWESAEVPSHSYPDPDSPEGIRISVVDRPHAVQSVIKVAHTTDFHLGAEDYVDARVMNLMLGGTFNRLDQNLREDHAYTYGVNSSLSQDKWIGNFSVGTDVRNEVTDSAVYQILYEIERIRSEKASAEEVEKIKNYMSGTFALALEQPSTVARFALNIARYDLPEDYYANYLKYIAATTPESVQAAAQKYLSSEDLHVLVVGKAVEISGGLQALAADGQISYFDEEGNPVDPSAGNLSIPAGLTAEKVIENYLSVIGGRENLERIQDLSIQMEMEVQGMTLSSTVLQKAPDKFKMTMRMGDMLVQELSYNGTTATSSGMGGEQSIEGKDLEDMRAESILLPELDYPGFGFKLKLVSAEELNGETVYKLEKTYPSGTSVFDYFSAETGYRLKEEKIQETPEGEMVQVTLVDDYREIDGMLYPHSMTIIAGPQTVAGKVTSIEVNTGIEDSEFK